MQCSGLAIKSGGVVRRLSRAADRRRYAAMETLEHPTHHRPFMIICGSGAAISVVVFIATAMLLNNAKVAMGITAGIFFTMLISSLIW